MKNLDLLLNARFLLAQPFPFIGEDDDDDDNDEGKGGDGDGNKGGKDGNEQPPAQKEPKNKKKPKVDFTPDQQDYVNSLMAEERRKHKEANQKTINQLETIKNRESTTSAEKTNLEQQIEDLKNSHLTEKELEAKTRKKSDAKKQEELDAANKRADFWQNKFNSTMIERSIVDAASQKEHRASNPEHIVALLTPKTRLVEVLDEDNKPTGEYVAKAKVTTTDKDGKPKVLEMTVTEAVKLMSEQDQHAGLFDSGATGGTGERPNRPARKGTTDPNEIPSDPVEYKKWREDNKKKLGARG